MIESYWQASGIAAPNLSPLAGDAETGALIVGAGYSGLNAALELAERGVPCMVIDALDLGEGASGRAGGFVSARFRMPDAKVRRVHGEDGLEILRSIGRTAVDRVAQNVVDYNLEGARFRHHGSISAALNERHLRRVQAAGRAAGFQILDRDQIASLTGSPRFCGGTLSPTQPGLHPLNYVRGMAMAAVRLGVPVHPRTPAKALSREAGRMVVATPSGRIRARHVIIATNAYSGLTQVGLPLARGVVPFRSAAIATRRLNPDERAIILPQDQMLFDSKRLLRWFRIMDDRLIVGGRGAGNPSQDDRAYAHMQQVMAEVFPQIARVEIEYRWSGYVGLTFDGLPHVGPVDDGVTIVGGYNGNGVAMASHLGRLAAAFSQGDPVEVGPLHVRHFRRLALHRLAGYGARLGARWYQCLDTVGL